MFQVFGHSKLDPQKADKIEFDNLALIDSQQCFMIDRNKKENIIAIKDYD